MFILDRDRLAEILDTAHVNSVANGMMVSTKGSQIRSDLLPNRSQYSIVGKRNTYFYIYACCTLLLGTSWLHNTTLGLP